MLAAVKNYILENPVKAVLSLPRGGSLWVWGPAFGFALVAVPLGLVTGVLRWEPVASTWGIFLAVSLLISPAFLEELVYRGLLIPRNAGERGIRRSAMAVGWSTLIYVISHPLAALTTSRPAAEYFLHPGFIAIVALLGVACSVSYIASRSLWAPVLIHWVTVLCWVFLFGGYEVVMALEGEAWGEFDG